ncbi:uncharacterized protein LOC134785791 [Penaeus indicus]|uniref:uncharacterized protein LOC134785791 n=1 Tax=Penaeus indicus TaxID=29960 RepID=UPI00300C441A
MYSLTRYVTKARVWGANLLPLRNFCVSSKGIDRESDVKWLFPAGSIIEKMNAAAKHSQLNLIVSLTLDSAVPLTVHHFSQTLVHLQRKVPSLRTLFRQKDQRLWVCETTEPDINFKVINNADVDTEIDRLIIRPFDKPDVEPPWLARLLLPSEGFSEPQLKEYLHRYNFLFSFHHGAVDGVSGLLIITSFLKLLEDVVTGSYINEELYGGLVSDEQTTRLEREMLEKLESNPEKFQRMIEETARMTSTPLINQAFGTPPKEEFPTRILRTVFERRRLQTLDERCRSLEITLNSGLTSVVNTALAELVAEAGLEGDSFSVTNRHAVNLRRYRKGDSFAVLGNHVGVISHAVTTPRHNRETFWEYAKQLDTEFRQKLKEGDVIQEKVIKSKLLPKDYSHEAFYSSAPPAVCDYIMTNVVVPQKYVTGKIIRLADYRNLCNISHCDYSMKHMLSSISAHEVTYTLMYATGRLNHNTAQAFLDKIIDVLSHMSR